LKMAEDGVETGDENGTLEIVPQIHMIGDRNVGFPVYEAQTGQCGAHRGQSRCSPSQK
jgi:hypothetical protein